ncbi:MAG: SDR family oxidoreductase [Calditrichaceae bacterium]|nr:SDR family oxidoreductase [Calditrichia bacterium]NUQ40854.1 SDR family oxidoreductase [Calditrichaceae bacterium]
MILIVGATSKLGRALIPLLLAEGVPVRAMTRAPEKAEDLRNAGVEIVAGDLRDPASLAKACAGAEKVLAAAHAFLGRGNNIPEKVDWAGNRHLIDAAKAAGVKHFVFTSALGAGADHPVDFFRIKYQVEEYLRNSGLSYTILRPAPFMEMWAELIGKPVVTGGKATIFGRGKTPVNFVSVEDLARFAKIALEDPTASGQIISIGGPENLTVEQVVEIFERVCGRRAKKSHVPLPLMRVMRLLTRPLNPALSRQIAMGIFMDTADQAFDMSDTLKRYPLELTRLEEVVRRRYGI